MKMTKIKIIIFFFSFILAFSACEKAEYLNDDDRTEQGNGDADNSDEDNTGTGEDNETDDSGIQLGDEVNVQTFCNTSINTQVWVKGYIVGAATGANNNIRYDLNAPFEYSTAILLADSPKITDDTDVMSVCLTSCSTKIRAKLNLKDNPGNIGKRIRVFGIQETYLKLFGIKHIDAYEFPL